MKGVVLAGGTGSRLSPLTDVTNKHLLPIYDEPMLYKVLKKLIDADITDIQIVLGGNSVGDIVRLVGSGKSFGKNVNISYVYQDQAGGIAEALFLNESFVGNDKIAVILGDNIFEDDFSEWVKDFEMETEYDCYIFLKEVENPERFGVAEIKDGNVVSIEEKPKAPKSKLAVTGMYFYSPKVFEVIKWVTDNIGYSNRNELEISDVNDYFVKKGSARAIKLEGFWSDAGKFDTLLRSSLFVARKKEGEKD